MANDLAIGEKIGAAIARALVPFVYVGLYKWLGWSVLWFVAGAETVVTGVWVFVWWQQRTAPKATPPIAPVVRIPGSGALQ